MKFYHQFKIKFTDNLSIVENKIIYENLPPPPPHKRIMNISYFINQILHNILLEQENSEAKYKYL